MRELLKQLEKMHYNCLGVSLTQKCNALCDMCSVSAGPNCSAKLNVDDVKRLIDSTKDIPFLTEICFTGGEVFCAYQELKELISYTSKSGKVPAIVTNAYWAVSYEKAREIIAELKQLGLIGIGFSYDFYHAEYIPVECVKNAIKAAYDENISYSTNITCTTEHSYEDTLLQLGECADIANPKKYYCSPAGRGKKNMSEEVFIRELSSNGLRCSESNRSVAVDFFGNIRPCCSSHIFSTELTFGKYNNQNVLDILTTFKCDPILYIIRNKGFDFFINVAINEFGLRIPNKVVSKCDLCEIFFSSENYEKFIPYAQGYFEELSSK